MSVDLRPLRIPDELEALRDLLSSMGWGKRVADLERLGAIVKRADRQAAAFCDGRLVGFTRALCDGVSNGYLSLVAVHPDFQGQGLGRRLVAEVMGDDPHITWVLRAREGSEEFWRKMGFNPSQVAMERSRAL